jgi:hypothetical protein
MNQETGKPTGEKTQGEAKQPEFPAPALSLTVESETPKPNGKTSKNHRDDKQKSSLAVRIEAGCAIALVIITGFYTYYAHQQAGAAIKSADAAKRAADTASVALHISERAYISISSPRLDFSEHAITLPLVNSGRIPSGAVEVVAHEATVYTPDPGSPVIFKNAIEYSWKRYRFPSSGTGNPYSIDITTPSASQAKIEGGLQSILTSGTIIYGDGFPDDPPQEWYFCFHTVYHLLEKRILIAPCDPNLIIPKMEALDGYPNNEQK